jgi:hypothetical protein
LSVEKKSASNYLHLLFALIRWSNLKPKTFWQFGESDIHRIFPKSFDFEERIDIASEVEGKTLHPLYRSNFKEI